MTLTNVRHEDILSAMVEALRPLLAVGSPPPEGAYLAQLDWHAGEFASAEAMMSSGIAGRCPAVLLDFGGDKVLRTMAAGRRQFVESTFLAICCSDSLRSRQDREKTALFDVLRDVREQLHGRRLGLDIGPLHYAGLLLVAKTPQLFAYACQFTTRYHVELGAKAPADAVPLGGISGDIKPPEGQGGSADVPIHFVPPPSP